jgi:hypothetical protein
LTVLLSLSGFDAYDRRARLYPSLIAALPAVIVSFALVPHASEIGHTLIAIAANVGFFYLFVNIARNEGKRVEPRLIEKWGGWPTTIVLRHRDTRIDQYTKKRYHSALAKMVPGTVMPSIEQEQQNPSLADEAYRSATNKLLENRRGAKYPLVQIGNAEYGFRRNMLGLKPWASIIAVIVASVLILVWWWPLRNSTMSERLVVDDLGNRWKVYLLFLGDLLVLIFWLFYVRVSWVRQSGFDYAHALLRTLDSSGRK